MNPYINIWFKTRKTIDDKIQSNWVHDYGFTPYLIYGLTLAIETYSDLLFLKFNTILILIIAIALGFVSAIITRAIGVNILFYIGKIWKGKASKSEIDTVLSLSLIPNILVSSYLVLAMALSFGEVMTFKENNIIVLVMYFFGLRILIFGIARVQKFSYGLAVLNIFVPQLIIVFIYLLIKEL